MNKVLIIEDERMSASRLKRLLTEVDDVTDVQGPLSTIDEVVETLSRENDFDLIFSDIMLVDGLVFSAFHEVMPNCPVIFITAYNEYAIQAFQNNGIDYLLKPISLEDLTASLHKVDLFTAPAQTATNLTHAATEMKCYRQRILVAAGEELIPISTKDIRYICTEDNHVNVSTRDGHQYRVTTTLNEFEEQLDPEFFFRLNRQYLAHIDSFAKISFHFNGKLSIRLVGCEDDHIIISKEKSSLLKRWLDR